MNLRTTQDQSRPLIDIEATFNKFPIDFIAPYKKGVNGDLNLWDD